MITVLNILKPRFNTACMSITCGVNSGELVAHCMQDSGRGKGNISSHAIYDLALTGAVYPAPQFHWQRRHITLELRLRLCKYRRRVKTYRV